MTIGQKLEHLRRVRGLSILDMCNILDCVESEYYRIICGKIRPTIFQLICAVVALKDPLKSIRQSSAPPYHILNREYKDYEY